MSYVLGERSLKRLEGVDERLVRVVKRAIQISTVDFTVIEGVRSLARQKQLYAQGRTAPGKVVTWTLKSKHIEGKAVDLGPVKNGALDWNDTAGFNAIAEAMFEAAGDLGLGLRWGKDWDRDGIVGEKGEADSPHFELIE